MSHHNTSGERRRHPRINKVVPLTLKAEDFDTVTDTINLSCLGAYCQLNRHIPLMTSLEIALELPRSDQSKDLEYAECQGVVVRVEEAGPQTHKGGVYNTAIYFNEIEESEREKIERLVEARRGHPDNIHPQP
jgi:hypothetical protein